MRGRSASGFDGSGRGGRFGGGGGVGESAGMKGELVGGDSKVGFWQ